MCLFFVFVFFEGADEENERLLTVDRSEQDVCRNR